MKHALYLILIFMVALSLYAAAGCSCDDNDDDDCDDNDDDAADDDADDDTADDDMADDDIDDDDTPPYNTELCEPAMAAIYEDCHLEIVIEETPLTREEAVASCENVEYLFWPCALDCYLEYDDACLDLYLCLQECIAA